MGKMIYYKLIGQPNVELSMSYTEENLKIVQAEAHNGEYTIEYDDDPEEKPNPLDILEAQVTYTAMMTDTLLEV